MFTYHVPIKNFLKLTIAVFRHSCRSFHLFRGSGAFYRDWWSCHLVARTADRKCNFYFRNSISVMFYGILSYRNANATFAIKITVFEITTCFLLLALEKSVVHSLDISRGISKREGIRRLFDFWLFVSIFVNSKTGISLWGYVLLQISHRYLPIYVYSPAVFNKFLVQFSKKTKI